MWRSIVLTFTISACSGLPLEKGSATKESTAEQPADIAGGLGLSSAQLSCEDISNLGQDQTTLVFGCTVYSDQNQKIDFSTQPNLELVISATGNTSFSRVQLDLASKYHAIFSADKSSASGKIDLATDVKLNGSSVLSNTKLGESYFWDSLFQKFVKFSQTVYNPETKTYEIAKAINLSCTTSVNWTCGQQPKLPGCTLRSAASVEIFSDRSCSGASASTKVDLMAGKQDIQFFADTIAGKYLYAKTISADQFGTQCEKVGWLPSTCANWDQ